MSSSYILISQNFCVPYRTVPYRSIFANPFHTIQLHPSLDFSTADVHLTVEPSLLQLIDNFLISKKKKTSILIGQCRLPAHHTETPPEPAQHSKSCGHRISKTQLPK